MTVDLSRAIGDAMRTQGVSARRVAQLTETTEVPVSYQTVHNYVDAPPGRMVEVAKLRSVMQALEISGERLEELFADGGTWRMPAAFDRLPEADRRRVEEFLDWALFRRR